MSKSNLVVNRDELAFTMSRVFDAPRELVWKVYTDPQLVPQWWGQRNSTTIVDKMEVKVGGVWRYIQKEADGTEYAFNGVYKEVKAPERLTYTFEFEPMAGHVSTDTLTFEEQPDGKTKVTARTTFDTLEDLEGMLQSGMEEGADESYDRLAELLQELQKEPQPDPELKKLDKLVGTWKVSGGAQGQVTYEWMEGGFFLMQHVDLEQYGQKMMGIEIIGHLKPFGEEPSADIKSRWYDNMGNTFDYVYELEGDTLTIWGGEKGSPAYFKGKFSADGNTLTGGWVYPGGGGYESTAVRIS